MLVEAPRTDDDALLAEVERFTRRVIEPRAARPELTMSDDAFATILAEADALGLAADAGSTTGLAPWDELEHGAAPARTLALLTRLARANAGVALAIHGRALGRALLRRAKLPHTAERPGVALQARLGLGRGALAAALAASKPLSDEERALLADVYAPEAERVLPIDPTMDALITLVFDGRVLGFQLHDRAALHSTRDSHAHGLNELHTVTLTPSAPARLHWAASADWIAVTIAADQLALVALALGAVDGAHALARIYAAQRLQAGRPIDRHPAVQMLLAKSRAQLECARGALEACAARPLSHAHFGSALGVRLIAMPALAEAAHACMQVFGGLGYMRDTGVERVARDVNALRALAGTPNELALVIAEWERLHV